MPLRFRHVRDLDIAFVKGDGVRFCGGRRIVDETTSLLSGLRANNHEHNQRTGFPFRKHVSAKDQP